MEELTVELKEKFEMLQKRMITLGMQVGLTDPAVLVLSQELGEVHNSLLKQSGHL